MLRHFEQFIRERRFLSNVTSSTLQWYEHSFKWLDTDSPSQEDLKAAVLRMREKGLKATLNTHPHWLNAGPDVSAVPLASIRKLLN
jgi:hypothetical protein